MGGGEALMERRMRVSGKLSREHGWFVILHCGIVLRWPRCIGPVLDTPQFRRLDFCLNI